MHNDPHLPEFVESELRDFPFTDAEKGFIKLLLIDNNKLEHSYYLYELGRFMRKQSGYSPETTQFALGEVTAASELMGLINPPVKAYRAIELLISGKSLSPIEDQPELWIFDADLGYYFHAKNPEFSRDTKTSSIMRVVETHYFPTANYRSWQGYEKRETLFGQEFYKDPFKAPFRYHYTRHWDGKGNLIDHLKTSPRELPEGTCEDLWLKEAAERKGLVSNEQRRINVLNRFETQSRAIL